MTTTTNNQQSKPVAPAKPVIPNKVRERVVSKLAEVEAMHQQAVAHIAELTNKNSELEAELLGLKAQYTQAKRDMEFFKLAKDQQAQTIDNQVAELTKLMEANTELLSIKAKQDDILHGQQAKLNQIRSTLSKIESKCTAQKLKLKLLRKAFNAITK